MSGPVNRLDRRATTGSAPARLTALAGVELRILARNRQVLVAALVLPLVFAISVPHLVGNDVAMLPFASFFVVGMIGFALVATTYTTLATTLPVQRDQLILKRLLGTPASVGEVLGAKALSGAAVAVVQVIVLGMVGALAYGMTPPAYPLTVAVFVTLGLATFSLLGMAAGGLLRDPAPAVVQLPVVALQFLSGAFVPIVGAPGWVETMAGVLPLKGLLDGLRAGYLGVDFSTAHEVNGTLAPTTVDVVSSLTSQWRGMVVMLTWCALAIAVLRRHIRWEQRVR